MNTKNLKGEFLLYNKMKIGIKVGDVMTRRFVSVSPDTNIIECARIMRKNKVGSLVVKEDKKLVGLLTEGEIINAIGKKKDLSKIRALNIMIKNPETVKPEVDMYDSLVIMKKRRIRWLPVVANKAVIGVLTLKDILRIEPSLFDILADEIEIKEEAEKLRTLKEGKKEKTKREELASAAEWEKEGECEECGAFGALFNVDGALLCEDCKDIET